MALLFLKLHGVSRAESKRIVGLKVLWVSADGTKFGRGGADIAVGGANAGAESARCCRAKASGELISDERRRWVKAKVREKGWQDWNRRKFLPRWLRAVGATHEALSTKSKLTEGAVIVDVVRESTSTNRKSSENLVASTTELRRSSDCRGLSFARARRASRDVVSRSASDQVHATRDLISKASYNRIDAAINDRATRAADDHVATRRSTTSFSEIRSKAARGPRGAGASNAVSIATGDKAVSSAPAAGRTNTGSTVRDGGACTADAYGTGGAATKQMREALQQDVSGFLGLLGLLGLFRRSAHGLAD